MNVIKDKNKWNSLLDGEFSEYNDIFFRYNYFELYEKYCEAVPEGIFWEDKNIKLFWTHLIRDISRIKQFEKFKYYDLTTPYGYGGPLIIIKTEDKEKINESLKEFFEKYKDYALRNNYICEFVRFHPIYKNWEFLHSIFNIEYLNNIAIINLNKDLEKIWQNIKKGHKYNIKKSIREGCKVEVINNPLKKNINNFIKIYYFVMDKNQASKKYYFPTEFINAHFKLLNAILIEVKYKSRTIGSSIFICGNKIVHYYLSGATHDFKGLYPSDLMLWEAIKWAKGNNFKILHLGGGRGENDSLFEFKKGFSDLIKPFRIGKLIFNANTYSKLSRINNKRPSHYFPEYRQGFDKKIV